MITSHDQAVFFRMLTAQVCMQKWLHIAVDCMLRSIRTTLLQAPGSMRHPHCCISLSYVTKVQHTFANGPEPTAQYPVR